MGNTEPAVQEATFLTHASSSFQKAYKFALKSGQLNQPNHPTYHPSIHRFDPQSYQVDLPPRFNQPTIKPPNIPQKKHITNPPTKNKNKKK